VVNNVVINQTTVVNVTNINVYRNTTVNNAVVAVRRDGFGRGSVRDARVEQVDVRQMRPVHGRLDVKPEPVSFVAAGGAAPARPAEDTLTRQVVARGSRGTRARICRRRCAMGRSARPGPSASPRQDRPGAQGRAVGAGAQPAAARHERCRASAALGAATAGGDAAPARSGRAARDRARRQDARGEEARRQEGPRESARRADDRHAAARLAARPA